MFSSCLIEKSGGNGRSVNASDVKQLMHERPGLTFIRRKEYECMSGCGCSVGECECSVGAGSKKFELNTIWGVVGLCLSVRTEEEVNERQQKQQCTGGKLD